MKPHIKVAALHILEEEKLLQQTEVMKKSKEELMEELREDVREELMERVEKELKDELRQEVTWCQHGWRRTGSRRRERLS